MSQTCPLCKCIFDNADFCPDCLWDFRISVDNQCQQILLQYAENRKNKNTEKQQIIANYENVKANYKNVEKQKTEKDKEKKQLNGRVIGKYTEHDQNGETLLSNERYGELSKSEKEYNEQQKTKKEIIENIKHIDVFENEKKRFKELYKAVKYNRYKFCEAEQRAKNKVGGVTKYNSIINKYTK